MDLTVPQFVDVMRVGQHQTAPQALMIVIPIPVIMTALVRTNIWILTALVHHINREKHVQKVQWSLATLFKYLVFSSI